MYIRLETPISIVTRPTTYPRTKEVTELASWTHPCREGEMAHHDDDASVGCVDSLKSATPSPVHPDNELTENTSVYVTQPYSSTCSSSSSRSATVCDDTGNRARTSGSRNCRHCNLLDREFMTTATDTELVDLCMLDGTRLRTQLSVLGVTHPDDREAVHKLLRTWVARSWLCSLDTDNHRFVINRMQAACEAVMKDLQFDIGHLRARVMGYSY